MKVEIIGTANLNKLALLCAHHISLFIEDAVEDTLWGHPPHRQPGLVSESVVVGVVHFTGHSKVGNLHTQCLVNPIRLTVEYIQVSSTPTHTRTISALIVSKLTCTSGQQGLGEQT